MSQLDVNVIAPLGYAGPNLVGNNNFVQIVDVNGDTIFKNSNIYNIAIGKNSAPNLVGIPNIAIGDESMFNATLAAGNVCLGSQSGINIIDGGSNTYIGSGSGGSTTSGVGNAALGNDAGYNITIGSNNICIGDSSFTATPTTSNSITLGNSSHTVIRAAVTTITSLSDERDKKEIQELPVGLEFVEKLKPVKFVWNDRDESGKHDVEDFGFIAQDLKATQEESEASYLNLVYESNPEKLEASYGKLLPVLVKAIQEMSSEIKSLKEEISTLKSK